MRQFTCYVPRYEWLLLFAKDAFRITSRNVDDLWRIPPEANVHPAPFPLALANRVMGTTLEGTVLDPFMGSGTTLRAAKNYGRRCIGIEISERYCEIAAQRLAQQVLDFGTPEPVTTETTLL
jgi:modification methylase